VIRGTALVIPSRIVAAGEGEAFTRETEAVERRAVEAVLAAERALGRAPEEMAHNNSGYDVRSTDRDGRLYYIEVKGRLEGSETFAVTTNEVTFAQTQGERHRLALVQVSPEGAAGDRLRYVTAAFTHIGPSATTRSFTEEWRDYWARGGPPR
jgi:hypothetical protein